MLTPTEMARVDAAADVPVEVLMDRAGHAVALAAVRMGAGYGRRVTILAGPGNNGGDGYVAARHLRRRGVATTVRPFGTPRPGSVAAGAKDAAIAAGVPVTDDPPPADLVIDAVFGGGFRGPMDAAAVAAVDPAATVLAVDIPSGVDAATGAVAGPAITADRTVAFHALKPGHLLGEGPERSGVVEVADIGLTGGDPVFMVCDDGDAPRPRRGRTTHKWSVGSVVVVGGSPGLSGAPLLAATAASRFGAGIVAILTPAGVHDAIAARTGEVISTGIGDGARFAPGDVEEVLAAASRFDVMVLGPGLGAGTERFVQGLTAAWGRPLVLDADGLNGLGGPDAVAARSAPTVLTPHGGEFTRLTGEPPSLAAAAELAEATGSVVLLKGSPTFVVGEESWAVTSGGPELATAGTGDVLSGMVAALCGRGLDVEIAARSAAHWHGVAGSSLGAATTVTAPGLAVHAGRFAR
ncbi:MAG: NAD(P)H-hydrate dehydratase [Acidimicrobiia bacterium]|nr:NAD(P)H-hydrate dehydratase [Acidimicrobiia bacterium]